MNQPNIQANNYPKLSGGENNIGGAGDLAILNNLVELFIALVNIFSDDKNAAVVANDTGDAVQEITQYIIDGKMDDLMAALDNDDELIQKVGKAYEGIENFISGIETTVKMYANSLTEFNELLEVFGFKIEDFQLVACNFIAGLVPGVANVCIPLLKVKDVVKRIFDKIFKAINKLRNSKLAKTVSKAKASVDNVTNKVNNITANATNALDNVNSNLTDNITNNVTDNITNNVTSNLDNKLKNKKGLRGGGNTGGGRKRKLSTRKLSTRKLSTRKLSMNKLSKRKLSKKK